MHGTHHRSLRLILALLFAASPLVPQQEPAGRWPAAACADESACAPFAPHALRAGDAQAALAASAVRFAFDGVRLDQRSGSDANVRGGIDVLFRMRSGLLLARAHTTLEEHRAAALVLHAATQGTAAAPSRAPPLS